MAAMMEADVTAVCGPKGRHDPQQAATRHGHAHLVYHREQRLLRWVGVDRSFAGSASPASALDAPAEEVESLIDVTDPCLGLRQA